MGEDAATFESGKADWSRLALGDGVTVVKLSPNGAEAARYPAEVVAVNVDDCWYVVKAIWPYDRRIELDGLSFVPGDTLLEWFSPHHPYNAFAVFAADGRFRGWYANVTHPAQFNNRVSPPVIIWHDLYVDLVGLPDGQFTVRDEDELSASRLSTTDPVLYDAIVRARRELVKRFAAGLAPFLLEPPE